MAKRKIIKIDESKCNGCGLCIPNCPEVALKVIDGKARLVSDLFCDGLGACIGYCPQGAITTEEREAQGYDEKKVMENIVKAGPNVIKAHLIHLIKPCTAKGAGSGSLVDGKAESERSIEDAGLNKEHNQTDYFDQALQVLEAQKISNPLEQESASSPKGFCSCPGSKSQDLRKAPQPLKKGNVTTTIESQLGNWPVQIKLVPAFAPYFEDAHLLIAADCVPFSYAAFHPELLEGKILLVGCPKLDDLGLYQEKINQILKNNTVKSITYARMEVSCCSGLVDVIKTAIASSGKDIPFEEVIISIEGKRLK